MSESSPHLFREFGLFLLTGAVTTLIDFLVYNLVTRKAVAWPRTVANILSSAVAMGFSFTVNWVWVFQPHDAVWMERAIKFLGVTCLSSFGLQSIVIHTLTKGWRTPVLVIQSVTSKFLWTRELTPDFVDRNFVKAAAVGLGLLWNFCGYKWFVYAG